MLITVLINIIIVYSIYLMNHMSCYWLVDFIECMMSIISLICLYWSQPCPYISKMYYKYKQIDDTFLIFNQIKSHMYKQTLNENLAKPKLYFILLIYCIKNNTFQKKLYLWLSTLLIITKLIKGTMNSV